MYAERRRLFIDLGKCHFVLQLFNCHHYMQPATHSSFCPQIIQHCSVKKLSFLIADSSILFIFYMTSALAHLRH